MTLVSCSYVPIGCFHLTYEIEQNHYLSQRGCPIISICFIVGLFCSRITLKLCTKFLEWYAF